MRPGRAAEYDRRHAEIWPELARLFREAGIREYHIYRWGEVLFSHMEAEDYQRIVARLGEDPIAARWEAEMEDLIEYPNADPGSGWPERLHRVWSLPAAGEEDTQ